METRVPFKSVYKFIRKSMSLQKILVMVESPAKVKSISKILGRQYVCMASYGHIMDLPVHKLGVDVKKDFEMDYAPIPGKEKQIQLIKTEAQNKREVLLATDPDREGEVIAWHISMNLPDSINYRRVTFNAITESAIEKALESPRDIDFNLIGSQKARRAIDRLVGYKVSSLLNKGLGLSKHKHLSAGRVQSAALSLIVDREKEILGFVPTKYWKPDISVRIDGVTMDANASKWKGIVLVDKKRPDMFLLSSKEKADEYLDDVLSSKSWSVAKVSSSTRTSAPPAPFTTAALQKMGFNKLGFSVSKTMKVAQALYEGMDVGKGKTRGLITYMRTDSIRIEPEAKDMAASFIKSRWGEGFLGNKVASKSKSTKKKKAPVQDAHEAIRPVDVSFSPADAEASLDGDSAKLYSLIWSTFIASEMKAAKFSNKSIVIEDKDKNELTYSVSKRTFDGFQVLLGNESDEEDHALYDLCNKIAIGRDVEIVSATAEEKATSPRPRYSEGALVASLETLGIGRPSTYAPILNKIKDREYTFVEKGVIKPTEMGIKVIEWLKERFSDLTDIEFTAKMETTIEGIADKRCEFEHVLRDFWSSFSVTLESVYQQLKATRVEVSDKCAECGADMLQISTDRYSFIGCSRYPACKYIKPSDKPSVSANLVPEDFSPDFDWNQNCKKCGGAMSPKVGKYGAFISCVNPGCGSNISIPMKNDKKIMACVVKECVGDIWEKTKGKKSYYICSHYKECRACASDLDSLKEKFQGMSLQEAAKMKSSIKTKTQKRSR